MDVRKIIDQVLAVADTVADYIPKGDLVDKGVAIGRKVLGIIDDLGEEIPLDKQEEVQATRAKLADAVAAKADRVSSRLRG